MFNKAHRDHETNQSVVQLMYIDRGQKARMLGVRMNHSQLNQQRILLHERPKLYESFNIKLKPVCCCRLCRKEQSGDSEQIGKFIFLQK